MPGGSAPRSGAKRGGEHVGTAGAPTPADLMARAAEHGDEHVIKLTDTALDAYARTADPALLTAATHCAELIDPPR